VKLQSRETTYVAPALAVLGPLHERTLQDKKSGLSDGMYLLTVGPLANNSA
jgi:hypothetical protein